MEHSATHKRCSGEETETHLYWVAPAYWSSISLPEIGRERSSGRYRIFVWLHCQTLLLPTWFHALRHTPQVTKNLLTDLPKSRSMLMRLRPLRPRLCRLTGRATPNTLLGVKTVLVLNPRLVVNLAVRTPHVLHTRLSHLEDQRLGKRTTESGSFIGGHPRPTLTGRVAVAAVRPELTYTPVERLPFYENPSTLS
jgi:hypothetical protein